MPSGASRSYGVSCCAGNDSLVTYAKPSPPPQTLSGNTQTAGGRSDGILAWTSSRLKNTVETIASREWQLIKHDIEEFVTPAWVNQEKQRAEYLSRVARAERRMGRVRLARLEKIVQGWRKGDRGWGGVALVFCSYPYWLDFMTTSSSKARGTQRCDW